VQEEIIQGETIAILPAISVNSNFTVASARSPGGAQCSREGHEPESANGGYGASDKGAAATVLAGITQEQQRIRENMAS